MKLTAIPGDSLAKIWPEIAPGLAKLLEQHGTGRWTVPQVLENLQAEQWQLFIVWDESEIVACLICSIVEGERKTFEIGLCWGRGADDWAGDVNQAFEQVGREMGCDQLALDGRPGWRKIMRQLGYELKSVTYTRRINGQH